MSKMSAKGYGKDHWSIRKSYKMAVDAGEATCSRCFLPIAPRGEPCSRCGRPTKGGSAKGGMCGWDLDHRDDLTLEERQAGGRGVYAGVSHACCNRRAGAKNAARQTNAKKKAWSRRWLSD